MKTHQPFNNLLLSNFCEPVLAIEWSSAAVAHLLQSSMCCVFRDAVLHTLKVTVAHP